MRLQLSFWEAPPSDGAPPVWPTLDDEQRAEVLATLARLIAKAAICRSQESPANRGEEKADE